MKLLLVTAAFVALAYAKPFDHPTTGLKRNYYPEEEDPHRIESITWQDEDGNLHYEDLTQKFLFQRKAKPTDVTVYLHTREKAGDRIVPSNFSDFLDSEHYDHNRMNLFIIHGWNNYHGSELNRELTKAFLINHDVNIFVVDWSGPANNKNYLVAKGAIKVVGTVIGDFINEMKKHYGLTGKNFGLYGHSLGAHAAGIAGATVTDQVDHIVGMDPAGPFFSLKDKANILDATDAEYVQIVHTNGGLLAFLSSLGHVDFYPNGGKTQAGCDLDVLGICSHSRAWEYVVESIPKSGFNGRLCDSYDDFKEGKCNNNPSAYMGGGVLDKLAEGDYYLDTNRRSPFSLN